jgi:uncharacterized membrane protein/predicted DsbA family dithiol-disulfide isomerase
MKLWKSQKQTTSLPYPYYFFTVVVIALIGFFDSIYLSISHYRVYTDMGYQSFCAISQAINCDTVSQSPYSILFGVSVPVWGVLCYAFFLILQLFAWPKNALRKRVWTLLFLISLGFTVYSLVLAFISTYRIQSYCIMCILSYAVNLLLLYFTWIIRNRFQCESIFKAIALDIHYLFNYPRTIIPITSVFGVGAVLMLLYFPAYWQMTPPDLSEEMNTGVTEDGHPWIGAENPELVIVEFSDYRCFQCKKMHFFLRRIIQQQPDKIRLVHRHFPMDHTINPIVDQPFHTGAARLAIVSIFAAEKDKFWEMNDILFNIDRQTETVNIQDLVQKTDIDFEEMKQVFANRELWLKLQQDIHDGLNYGLTGTPGFIIDNQVYLGQIPPEVLRRYIR